MNEFGNQMLMSFLKNTKNNYPSVGQGLGGELIVLHTKSRVTYS